MKANEEFFIDNSAAIIQELETKVNAEITEIKSIAEKDIKSREKLVKEELSEIRQKWSHLTENAVKTLKSNKARNLESEQKRMILLEKQILIKKVLEMTHNYFLSLPDDPRYQDFMVRMLALNLPLFQDKVKLTTSPKLAPVLEKYLKDHPGHDHVTVLDPTLDGFILSDTSGHLVCDNSLEGIWRRRKEDVVREINKDVDMLAANLEYCRTLGQTCELKI